jgi:hypothetical protein
MAACHSCKVYEDAGISGGMGRDQRPGLDAMMKAVILYGDLQVGTIGIPRRRACRCRSMGWSCGFYPCARN